MITPVVLSVTVFIAAAFGFQRYGRYIYSYRLTEDAFQVALFGFLPIVRVSYTNIAAARKMTWKESLRPSLALRVGNRLVGDVVVIQKRTGMIRSILLTPDDASVFTDQIGKHLAT